MKKIRFTEKAVAFLDILGFKELVIEAHRDEKKRRQLQRLMNTMASNAPLNRGLKTGVPKALLPASLEISDSIILSTPMHTPGHDFYNGLAVLVMRSAQLAAILRKDGFLLTGGINVGQVHHTSRNVVGVTYQDAYLLQERTKSPAIVLSDEAVRLWDASDFGGGRSQMCVDTPVLTLSKNAQGQVTKEPKPAKVVNLFEPEYLNSIRVIGRRSSNALPEIDDRWLQGQIDATQSLIDSNLAKFGPQGLNRPSVLEKWQWFADLFRTQGKPFIQQAYSIHPDLVNQNAG